MLGVRAFSMRTKQLYEFFFSCLVFELVGVMAILVKRAAKVSYFYSFNNFWHTFHSTSRFFLFLVTTSEKSRKTLPFKFQPPTLWKFRLFTFSKNFRYLRFLLLGKVYAGFIKLSQNPEKKPEKKNRIFSKLVHFCQKLIVKALLSFGSNPFIFSRVTFDSDSCGLWLYFDADFDADFAQYSRFFVFCP